MRWATLATNLIYSVNLRAMKSEKKNAHFIIVFVLLLLQLVATAQVKFYATAPKACGVNQNFQLSYTVENGSGSNLKLAPLNDFQVVGGPNTSSSMQWVNGQVTQSVTYSYILKPKAEGTFKIGKASITVSGVTMESNEVSIEIGKPVAQQPQRQQRGWDPFADDPFFNPQAQPQEPEKSAADLQEELKNDVLMRVIVSKNSAYKGEMLTATYKLYFRQNLTGFNVTKAPAFDGFWSQEVELDPKRKQQIENYNGKQYYTLEVMKYNLYPQRDGQLTIPHAEVNTTALIQNRSRSRNPFDDFFNVGRQIQVPLTLKTNTLSVAVKELPATGQPDNFNGAVGKYSFEAKVSGKETKTDEPITYTMKVSGTGNLKFVEAPKLEAPEEFEVYEPKVKENISNSADGLSGSKQYDYLLIPRLPGDYKLSAYQFSYFDPSAAKYITLTSPEFAVKVTGEPSINLNTDTTLIAEKQIVRTLGKEIRYIKTNTPEFSKTSFYGSWKFVLVYGSPFLLFIGLVALRKRNDTLDADIIGTKRRKALKLAKQRLNKAEKYLHASDKKNFYTELSLGIWGYLSNKLNIDISNLSKNNAEETLATKQVSADTIGKLKQLLTVCEQALYAPVGEGNEMKQNYEAGLNLLADLEAEIK